MQRALIVFVVACGHGSSLPDANTACTPEAREVTGTVVAMGASAEFGMGAQCAPLLIRNSTELTTVFNAQPPVPPAFANVDFTVDRIVIGSTNPAIRFVVDDGAQLVVGQQGFCQGAAPQCFGVIVHSTRDSMMVDSCPYVGPNPCNAP